MTALRLASRALVGALFVLAGWNHFRVPDIYESIVPPALPARGAIVAWSGIAEMLGGIGFLLPHTRRVATWGLLALLIAVFPANVYAALHGMDLGGNPVPRWILWARLPFQPLMMAWVWWSALPSPAHADRSP